MASRPRQPAASRSSWRSALPDSPARGQCRPRAHIALSVLAGLNAASVHLHCGSPDRPFQTVQVGGLTCFDSHSSAAGQSQRRALLHGATSTTADAAGPSTTSVRIFYDLCSSLIYFGILHRAGLGRHYVVISAAEAVSIDFNRMLAAIPAHNDAHKSQFLALEAMLGKRSKLRCCAGRGVAPVTTTQRPNGLELNSLASFQVPSILRLPGPLDFVRCPSGAADSTGVVLVSAAGRRLATFPSKSFPPKLPSKASLAAQAAAAERERTRDGLAAPARRSFPASLLRSVAVNAVPACQVSFTFPPHAGPRGIFCAWMPPSRFGLT
ncbi:metalloprotease [Marssonina coronariae]|uniref:Metalloprotease n=1 Tax=Diplocarpon coronariae TaxID=2795749 RepID=A0A218Z0Z1_9HELO|nr:metalloprotease [Marssonina coronariae]